MAERRITGPVNNPGRAGDFVQVVNTQTGAVATGTTTMPDDDTIPQKAEGTEFMTLAITPKNTSNTLIIEVVAFAGSSITNDNSSFALFQDDTDDALAAGQNVDAVAASSARPYLLTHKMTAGTTSATTFKVRIGLASAGTITFNGHGAGRIFGGVMASSITIREYIS